MVKFILLAIGPGCALERVRPLARIKVPENHPVFKRPFELSKKQVTLSLNSGPSGIMSPLR
jgi:hypothetical protein